MTNTEEVISYVHFGRPCYKTTFSQLRFLPNLLSWSVVYKFVSILYVFCMHLSCCVRKCCYLVLFVRMLASPTPDRVSRGVLSISCLLVCDWIGKFQRTYTLQNSITLIVGIQFYLSINVTSCFILALLYFEWMILMMAILL